MSTVRLETRQPLRLDANRRSGLDRTVGAPAGRGGSAMPRAASVHSAGQGPKHHHIGLTPFVTNYAHERGRTPASTRPATGCGMGLTVGGVGDPAGKTNRADGNRTAPLVATMQGLTPSAAPRTQRSAP